MPHLYIGLMSGTSADGIDAALVDFSETTPKLLATHYTPYSPALKATLLAITQPGPDEINRLGHLDITLGKAFAAAALCLLAKAKCQAHEITAIGSHGHTVRHLPGVYSLQIGDPNTIAAETGMTCIADFRRKDIALGGQGAPLVPAFHREILGSPKSNRVIVNIGGMANITLLPSQEKTLLGFDTGPGNALLDEWIQTHQQQTHDANGDWGRQGQVHTPLLSRLLADPYFSLPAPKSTGREYFNRQWLNQALQQMNTPLQAVDIQATLTALTATSIMNAIKTHLPEGDILICGGGARNGYLMETLARQAHPHFSVAPTDAHGVPADWMEAMAFAWLAKQRMHELAGNVPSVTGAKRLASLGGIYTSL